MLYKTSTVASAGSGSINNSKRMEGSSHYLGDKQDFDVSSKGHSEITNFQTKGLCSKRRNLVYRLGSETILR